MYESKKILALIPARGGSKRLKRKNVLPLLGKPLIAWSIQHALGSKYIDKVVVSTEDEEIAEVAKKFGAEVPFMRPKELAKDDTPTMDVVLHAINFFERKGELFDYLVLLQPTSPVREVETLDEAIRMLINHPTAQALVSVSPVEKKCSDFLVSVDEKGFLKQAPAKDGLFYLNGNLYIATIDSLKAKKSFFHDKTLAFVLPKWQAVDIDDIYDFLFAEAILRAKEEGII
ncbi:MAG: acylneuraminate cytidylyltransferase family protein [Gammaproteobacteria bacterium]|nr:MAG: acylneuraminate cytidylyltransferase family protein [Gammaproteobacteria bacterium]